MSWIFFKKKKPVLDREINLVLLNDGNSYIHPAYQYDAIVDKTFINNVSLAIKSIINDNSDHTICVFLNSVNAIKAVIADLNIKTESSIFCSYQKKLALKAKGYSAFEHIDAKDFKGVNFLTSRFNSAVDIPLDENPVVILATNLYYANHTMIDPTSEAIQIVGRFRNGADKIYAILAVEEFSFDHTKIYYFYYIEDYKFILQDDLTISRLIQIQAWKMHRQLMVT